MYYESINVICAIRLTHAVQFRKTEIPIYRYVTWSLLMFLLVLVLRQAESSERTISIT
jgi:hypothetical protein